MARDNQSYGYAGLGNKLVTGVPATPPAPFHNNKAFTLIEIMVVMLLVGIVVGVVVPRFDSGALQDSVKVTTRKIINTVSSLRSKSIAEQKTYVLVIDVSNDRFWIVDNAMDELAMATAAEKAVELPGDIHFVDVAYPNQEQIRSGIAEIQFHPAGYSDQVLIHMQTDDDQRLTYLVQPLLPKVKVADEWLQY